MDLDNNDLDDFDHEGENGLGGGGPSEKELQLMADKFQDEQNIILELSGKGGPTSPTEWFCTVSHLNFQLNDLKKLVEDHP
jgi:hypothetical protein